MARQMMEVSRSEAELIRQIRRTARMRVDVKGPERMRAVDFFGSDICANVHNCLAAANSGEDSTDGQMGQLMMPLQEAAV